MSQVPFEELTPTTITFLGTYSKPINLRIAFEYLDVIEKPTISIMNTVPRNKKVHFPFIEEIGILSLRLKDPKRTEEEGHQYDKKCSWQSRGLRGNAPFSNCLAFDASIKHGKVTKNISAKVFPGGKFLFNGFLNRESAENFAQDLLDQLIDCGATDEDNELEWFDSQTINFTYYIGYRVNLVELGKILHEANLISGYDNLSTSNKIEIVLESKIDKGHLKTKKEAVQRIKIHESGKVLQNGPDMDELKASYELITNFLNLFEDRVKIVTKEPSLSTLNDRIIEALEAKALTSHEITKSVGIFKKSEINTGIQHLLFTGKIKIIDEDCYEKN